MKHPLPIIAAIGGLALATAAHAGDVNLQPKRVMVPVTDDAWRFAFAMPAWATWLKGDTGINGVTSHIDLDPTDIMGLITAINMGKGHTTAPSVIRNNTFAPDAGGFRAQDLTYCNPSPA